MDPRARYHQCLINPNKTLAGIIMSVSLESSGSAGDRCEATTMGYSAVGSIVTLILSLLIAPLTAAAQSPGTVYRVGVLSTEPPLAHLWEALLDGLRERG